MGAQKTAVRTPTSAPQLASVIASVWPGVFGTTTLTPEGEAMLIAQIGVECGPNFTNVWNYNVGNLEPTGGFDYVELHVDGGLRPFRAFSSFVDGVTGYLSLLHAKYAPAVASALAGNLGGFVSNLKAVGYFEEPAATYLAAMTPEYAAIRAQLGGGGDLPSPAPTPSAPSSTTPPTTTLQAGIGAAVVVVLIVSAIAAAFRSR